MPSTPRPYLQGNTGPYPLALGWKHEAQEAGGGAEMEHSTAEPPVVTSMLQGPAGFPESPLPLPPRCQRNCDWSWSCRSSWVYGVPHPPARLSHHQDGGWQVAETKGLWDLGGAAEAGVE